MSQNSHQVFFFEFCEISKKTFSYRKYPVAASRFSVFQLLRVALFQ